MKALSMTQPWAQALFLDLKHFETRSWFTNYRGPLLIHAAKGFPKYAREFAATERALGRGNAQVALGAIIGKVDLLTIWHTEELMGRISGLEKLYGDYSPGRYAWKFTSPLLLVEPIPYRGSLGLFNVDESTLNLVYQEDHNMSIDQEHFYPSAGVEPAFPLKCVACAATHDGGIDVAIDDGWNFCVYTTSQGIVQFAGCPLHGTEYESKSLAFLKGKIDIPRRI